MTKQKVIEKLQKNNLLWMDFQKWITGQELYQSQASEMISYCSQDVDQFISLKKEGLNVYWNQ